MEREGQPGQGYHLPGAVPYLGSSHTSLLNIQQGVAGKGFDAKDNGGIPLRSSPASAPAFLLDARNNDITYGACPCRAVQCHPTSTGCQHDSKFWFLTCFL